MPKTYDAQSNLEKNRTVSPTGGSNPQPSDAATCQDLLRVWRSTDWASRAMWRHMRLMTAAFEIVVHIAKQDGWKMSPKLERKMNLEESYAEGWLVCHSQRSRNNLQQAISKGVPCVTMLMKELYSWFKRIWWSLSSLCGQNKHSNTWEKGGGGVAGMGMCQCLFTMCGLAQQMTKWCCRPDKNRADLSNSTVINDMTTLDFF